MTVKELRDLLDKLMLEDNRNADRDVMLEGCDCSASIDGVSIDGSLWLRREDGVINTLGSKQKIRTI